LLQHPKFPVLRSLMVKFQYYENQEEIEQDIRYNNPSEEELARRARRWKKLSSLRSIDHEKGLP
ncbi:hypothetical protein HKBW3S06_01567, partial [Candidatus Hakubella thermalkaliphila]